MNRVDRASDRLGDGSDPLLGRICPMSGVVRSSKRLGAISSPPTASLSSEIESPSNRPAAATPRLGEVERGAHTKLEIGRANALSGLRGKVTATRSSPAAIVVRLIPSPARSIEVDQREATAPVRRSGDLDLRVQNGEGWGEVAAEGRVAAFLLRDDVTRIAVGLQTVSEARAPELALVEKEATGLQEKVSAHGPALAVRGAWPPRAPPVGARGKLRRLRGLLETGEADHRSQAVGSDPVEALGDRVKRDQMVTEVEMHLVVRKEVGPASGIVRVARVGTAQRHGLFDGRRPVQLERVEVHQGSPFQGRPSARRARIALEPVGA